MVRRPRSGRLETLQTTQVQLAQLCEAIDRDHQWRSGALDVDVDTVGRRVKRNDLLAQLEEFRIAERITIEGPVCGGDRRRRRASRRLAIVHRNERQSRAQARSALPNGIPKRRIRS